MTRQQKRPVNQFGKAIYESLLVPKTNDFEQTVRGFRDRLIKLASLRDRHKQFVSHCIGHHNPFESGEPDAVELAVFREATAALRGETLASRPVAETSRHLEQHLRRISHALAVEFFTELERAVDDGSLGSILFADQKLAKCTLPSKARSQKFASPFSVMSDAANSPQSDGHAPPAKPISVEFFGEQNVLLARNRRIIRRFDSVRQVYAKATPPIRRFLRVVTGEQYRAQETLASGKFGTVVLFHYVLDCWTDEAGEETSKPVWMRPFRVDGSSIVSRLRHFLRPLVAVLAFVAVLTVLSMISRSDRTDDEDIVESLAQLRDAITAEAISAVQDQHATLENSVAQLKSQVAHIEATDPIGRITAVEERIESMPSKQEVAALDERLRELPTKDDLRTLMTKLDNLSASSIPGSNLMDPTTLLTKQDMMSVAARVDSIASTRLLQKSQSDMLAERNRKAASVPVFPASFSTIDSGASSDSGRNGSDCRKKRRKRRKKRENRSAGNRPGPTTIYTSSPSYTQYASYGVPNCSSSSYVVVSYGY